MTWQTCTSRPCGVEALARQETTESCGSPVLDADRVDAAGRACVHVPLLPRLSRTVGLSVRSKAPQGFLKCWLDLLPPEDAKAFPPDDVALPPALDFEVSRGSVGATAALASGARSMCPGV